LPSLTLHPSQSGTFPYLATAFPLEGAVPSGKTVESPDDPLLSASVLSRWPDGSAAVVVMAGEASVAAGAARTLALRTATRVGTPLTAARVGQLVSDISLSFGGAGNGSISGVAFNTPDRIWWANDRVICCRYRLPVGAAGLEALIDVHAFASNRALVEVVVENGKLDASATSPTAPANASYSGATVSVNGNTIATVSSPSGSKPNSRISGSYSGGHEAFRAWYCSSWIGGDPQLEVTHDTASLQAHPLFFRSIDSSTENLQTKYGQTYDSYVPWSTCRLRTPGMDTGGDDEEIALYTECQSDYLLSGNRYSRRAVLATGLAVLSCDINWRDQGGEIPTQAQVSGKNTSNGRWPSISSEPRWGGSNTHDGSHIPAVGLVPFLCRPSPCFIEIAQKEFAWNHTNYSSMDGGHPYDQVRSRAWRARNYAATIFLTPDADASRKAGYRSALANNIPNNNAFFNLSYNTLGVMWGAEPAASADHSGRARFQTAGWMNHFCIMAWHMVDKAKVLLGADAAAWTAMTDALARYPVRWINEAVGGEWRFCPYTLTIGDAVGATINMGTGNWGEMTRSDMTGSVPATSGPWMNLPENATNWSSANSESSGGNTYASWFWAAFCCSVERNVSGASAAWEKSVTNGGISNFATWRQGFRTAPRFNRWPRNK